MDVILLKSVNPSNSFPNVADYGTRSDFLAYCMFAFSSFRVPDGLPLPVHIMRYARLIPIIPFEAHSVHNVDGLAASP